MNTDPQHWPEEIFNRLATHSFGKLTASEQASVLACMSEADYNSLHHATAAFNQVRTQGLQKAPDTKHALLTAFDKKYTRNGVWVQFTNPRIWQAAAAIVLLLSGWMCAQLIQAGQLQVPTSVLADTVYIKQEIKSKAEQLHDTVYIYKTRYMPTSNQSAARAERQEQYGQHTYTFGDAGEPAFDVNNLDSILGTPRGSSMKDDSLILRYGVSTL